MAQNVVKYTCAGFRADGKKCTKSVRSDGAYAEAIADAEQRGVTFIYYCCDKHRPPALTADKEVQDEDKTDDETDDEVREVHMVDMVSGCAFAQEHEALQQDLAAYQAELLRLQAALTSSETDRKAIMA